MKKISFIFYLIFQFSSSHLFSEELDKVVLYKIQDKLLSCILETAKIQKEYQLSGVNLIQLEQIISNIEKIHDNSKYYFDMDVCKVKGCYKVKLYLNSYFEFIFDEAVINNYKKFNQAIEYSELFESYYLFMGYRVDYYSKLFSFTSEVRNPIISYVRIENNVIIVLKPSELDPNYVEKDKTNSFFINETCR